MKKLFLVMCMVFMSSVCAASPFLVCDPYDPGVGVTDFLVNLNGNVYTSPADDGALKFDLNGLVVNGTNTVSVTALNLWGESLPTPFVFSAGAPVAPSGVGLQK